MIIRHDDTPVTLTIFQGVKHETGRRELSTVGDVLRGLLEPQPRTADKLAGGGWSPATFKGDHRARPDVEAVWALGFDVDEEPVPSVGEIVAAVRHRGAVHNTWSHGLATEKNVNGSARYRLLVVLSRPVSGGEYDRLWQHVAGRFGFKVGQASKDPSRFWFAPCAAHDGAFEAADIPGKPLDVDAVLSSLPPVSEPPRPDPTAAPAVKTGTRESIDLAAQMLGSQWPPKGKRHHAQLALAGALCRDGWEQAETLEFLCHVCRVAGDEDRDKRASTVADTYRKSAEERAKYTGWATLERYVPPSIVGAARDMLKKYEAPWVLGVAAPAEKLGGDEPRWMTAAERALKIGGPTSRLATGFPTIDACTRGGPALRKVVVIGGAPGAGKTATAIQMAYGWASQGIHVAVLASDEDADGLLTRFGQLAGSSRDDIENGDANTRSKLAEWCEAHPNLMLVDGDDTAVSVEAVSKRLRQAAGAGPSVLIVDSIQTVPIKGETRDETLRARTDAVVSALKHAAKVDGHLVIATSEVSRAAYRNKDQAENIDPLAAFKESGAIEYGVGLAMVLVSQAGSSDLVDAVVAKNRLGVGKPRFLLQLNHARAAVTETDQRATDATDPLAKYKAAVLALFELTENQEGKAQGFSQLSKNVIKARVTGRATYINEAIDALLDVGRLRNGETGGIRRARPDELS